MTYDYAGQSISSGDINGDGIDDVLIGARRVAGRRGAGYVIFGKESGLMNMTLASLSGNGFRLLGANASGNAGLSTSSGDINGDGIDDVLIGARRVAGRRGAGYVIFGKESGLSNITLPLGSNDGFAIRGAMGNDRAGISISSGDINDDGIDDALIGATGVDNGSITFAGAGYTVLGACRP